MDKKAPGGPLAADVIIPAYKPDQKFLKLLTALERQTKPPENIIIINTEKKYLERLIAEAALKSKHPSVIVRHITEEAFDHGSSRNRGALLSDADCFIMMTQDAVPMDNFLIENLLTALTDEKTATAYARQCPAANGDELEQYTRYFNYGREHLYKTKKDLPQLGIKTYFCSNVCAAYRKDIFKELGGFIDKTIFNEDMIYAAKAINSGYAVQYLPSAAVCHGHKYNSRQMFRRNFDLGVSHADHPEVFSNLSSESEGLKMIRNISGHLLRKKRPELIIKLHWQSLCKYAGYYIGTKYRLLPRIIVKKFSMNKNYWH